MKMKLVATKVGSPQGPSCRHLDRGMTKSECESAGGIWDPKNRSCWILKLTRQGDALPRGKGRPETVTIRERLPVAVQQALLRAAAKSTR